MSDSSSPALTATKILSITVAVVQPITNTGFLAPSANTAITVSAGDNNGFEITSNNAYSTDSLFAVDTNSGTNTSTSCTNTGKDKHNYYNYNLNLPVGASIKGIEVRLDAKVTRSTTNNAPFECAQISWDGGVTWTATKSTTTLTTTTATYLLGSATDTWGRTWSVGDFNNTNFRVRLINVAASTIRTFSLDGIAVQVTYQ